LLCFVFFVFYLYCVDRDLHSFPTRRSSDLLACVVLGLWHAMAVPSGSGELLGLIAGREKIGCRLLALPVPVYFQIAWVLNPCLLDRKSTRLNSSHVKISYAVFCLKKKKNTM